MTKIILWFRNNDTNEAFRRYLVATGIAPTQIVLPLRDGNNDIDHLRRAADQDDVLILTEVSPDPRSHKISKQDPRYFVLACDKGAFMCFVWDDCKSYHDIAERRDSVGRWRSTPLSLPVTLRCSTHVSQVFWMALDDRDSQWKRFCDAIHRDPTSYSCLPSCDNPCLVGENYSDTNEADRSRYENWDILVLDDQALTDSVNPSPSDLRNHCKLGRQALEFCESAIALWERFPGDWHIGGTEAACTLLCLDKSLSLSDQTTCMSMPRLKDPVYAFDNYDVILLDVLFDLRIASDIRFVPRAARLTKSPVFMFSSAGREGTHGESALYYATRSLRLGAIGFIDKDDVRERPWQALETISRITGWNEWQREWNERFASSAEHFLGGADGPLVRRLTESAREDAAERIRIGSAFGTSLEHETRKIRDRFYYLLCKLFEDCDHIEYDRAPEAGVGAGAKFFVKPFRNGRCDNSKFVKIGQYADLQFEEQNFNQCISGYLDTFTGQVFRPIVRADRYAGIVYSAVGYSDNRQGRCKDLRNLTDLVFDIVERLGTKEEVHRVIEELDHSFFSRLYRERGHLHKRVGRRERRSNEQRSAERFVFDHCGVASVDQWWRREYQDLLPPAYSFEIDSATSGIERLPSCERSESHTGHVPSGDGSSGHIAGRLVSYKARVTKDEEPEIELQLIDPFRHRRIRVAFKGVDQSKEVLLSYGKWLKVPYEGSQPKQTDVCYELRQRLKESLTDIAVRQRGGEGNAAPVGTPYRTLLKSIGHVSIRDAVGTPDWSILALFHKLCEAMGYLDRDCKQGEVEFNEIPMTLTTIHGDLNLGNIMVGSASDKSVSRNFWLIDFEKTHLYGHLARDFAKLESDVRHFVVSKVLIDSMVLGALKEPGAGAARRELVSALATQRAIERSVWEGSALIGISDPLRTAYEWIRELRQLATSRYGVSQDELKISVFLHCMSSLKFTKGYGNPKQEPYGYFPRLVYYGAAEALSDDIVRIIESANDRHAGESH